MTGQAIKTRSLGNTDIHITPIGLGVMQFAGGKGFFGTMFPHIPQAVKNEIIQTALDGGINWFDTAEIYGGGRSERALSETLKAAGMKDDEVVVATKWNPFFRTAGNIPRTIDKRLRNLSGYSIDLYQIHQPYSFSSPESEMDAMADLVEAGKIAAVGVSNFDADRMRRAHVALEKRGLKLASNQVRYNLVDRRIETNGILDTAKELGITIICWGPLASGLLTGKFHQDPGLLKHTPPARKLSLRRGLEESRELISALTEIAAKHSATPAQVALNWLVNFQGETVVAIPGASKPRHAKEAAGAMQLTLSEDEMDRLDTLSQRYRMSKNAPPFFVV
ncbi:MAG: aldo/keto reductase [Anaerolineales bacterium]|jgi:aryl-alcohol dehydrogenase-like predicted oxidoreductase